MADIFKALLPSGITKIMTIIDNEGHVISCRMLFSLVSNFGTNRAISFKEPPCFNVDWASNCKQNLTGCSMSRMTKITEQVHCMTFYRLHSSIKCFGSLVILLFFSCKSLNFAKSDWIRKDGVLFRMYVKESLQEVTRGNGLENSTLLLSLKHWLIKETPSMSQHGLVPGIPPMSS